jgi:hypothetical protein
MLDHEKEERGKGKKKNADKPGTEATPKNGRAGGRTDGWMDG